MNDSPLDGPAIARLGRFSVDLAERLVAGIDADRFARQPPGADGERVNCNHPAFILGHLALYPAKMLDFFGRPSTDAAPPDGFADRFVAGVDCRDDPDGDLYPPMHEIVEAFNEGHTILLDTLSTLDPALLAAANPHEGLRDRLGLATVGEAVTFMLTSHAQFHLGQLSTWRRAMGMGSVM